MLVCPDCGHDQFEATLTTRTEYTYQVDENRQFIDVAESVVDGGDVGDIDTLDCADCGGTFDPDELVTEAGYDMLDAHAEGLHADLAREGCPECNDR